MKKFRLAALALSFLATAAWAQSTKGDATLPPAVQIAVTGGMKFEKSFPAPGGMTGWLLSQGVDTNIIVYTTANGEAAVAGTMLDAKGANLTKEHLAQHAPKPDYEKLWAELDKAPYLIEGARGKDVKSTIYVFKDANCSYCHLEWKALQPYTKVGLQVRWVPVAFLAADSFDKAAALMTAKDSGVAIAELHDNWGKRSGVLTPPSPQVRAQIEANNKMMQSWGFRGTPATFYRDAKTGKVKAINGMVSLSDLPAVTGMPAIPNNDPALARFR